MVESITGIRTINFASAFPTLHLPSVVYFFRDGGDPGHSFAGSAKAKSDRP